MYSFIYLAIATIFGWSIKHILKIDTSNIFKIAIKRDISPPTWTFDLPFSIIVGTTILTTINYFIALLFSVKFGSGNYSLFISNIICFIIAVIFFIYVFTDKNKPLEKIILNKENKSIKPNNIFITTAIVFTLFGVFLTFYTFFIKDGILNSGVSVFSDFAPHTAVISSFSKGNNFPAQYPHFAGEGMNYHFFFFFLCANLQYLGLNIDFAMNIPSIIGIVSFTTLLGCLAVLLTGKRKTFLIAPLMLFLRSSYAIFAYLGDLAKIKNVNIFGIISEIFKTNIFIGKTIHDDWGLWAVNVYANQRHLLWGFSIILIIMILFLPTLNRTIKSKNIFDYIFRKEFWKIRNINNLIISTILIFILPYWHGSMLITILCIFVILVFFAKERFAYVVVGLTGLLASLFWSSVFSQGASNVATLKFLWGFISPDKSILGVTVYLLQVIGIALIIILFMLFNEKNYTRRALMISFLAPVIFALTISLTPDVTVNHKYIIAAVALFNIFIADFICSIYDRLIKYMKKTRIAFGEIFTKNGKRKSKKNNTLPGMRGYSILLIESVKSLFILIVAILLSFALFSTGVVETIGYINKNKNYVAIDINSPLVKWVDENTKTTDIFLTAQYSMNKFFFTGRKIFYGWPYYTWSAGYDTDERREIYRNLLIGYGGDLTKFKETIQEYNIKYIIIDGELLINSEYQVNQEFFEANFTKALDLFAEDGTIIYKLS